LIKKITGILLTAIFIVVGFASPASFVAAADPGDGEITVSVPAVMLPDAAGGEETKKAKKYKPGADAQQDIRLLIKADILNKDIYEKSFEQVIDANELNGVLLSLRNFMGGAWFDEAASVEDKPVTDEMGEPAQAVRRSDAVGSLAVAVMSVKPDEWPDMREGFFEFLSESVAADKVVTPPGVAAADTGITREEMFMLISRMVWKFERDRMKEFAPVPDTPVVLNEQDEAFYRRDVYLYWNPVEHAETYIVRIYDDSRERLRTIKVHEPVLNITRDGEPSFGSVFGEEDGDVRASYTVQAVAAHGIKSEKTGRVGFTALRYESARERYGTDYIKYKNGKKGEKRQTTVTLNVWREVNGEIVPATVSIRVHRKMAASVRQIFGEYFSGRERFPIQSIGGFSIREKRSEHNYGTAIDINPNENYMVGPGGAEAGAFWNPAESAYSISPDSELVRAFERHGWYWAGNGWGDTYDFMHFSFMGT
jgi:hypothetical protein